MSAWGYSWLRRWGASWGAVTQDFSEYLLDDSVTPVFLETPKEALLTRVERVIFNEQRPFVVHYQSRERCFAKPLVVEAVAHTSIAQEIMES